MFVLLIGDYDVPIRSPLRDGKDDIHAKETGSPVHRYRLFRAAVFERFRCPGETAAELLWIIAEDMGPELACYGASPESREVLGRLRAALDTWIVESNDQGRFPESPEIIQHWEEQMKKNYDAKLRRRAEAKKKE